MEKATVLLLAVQKQERTLASLFLSVAEFHTMRHTLAVAAIVILLPLGMMVRGEIAPLLRDVHAIYFYERFHYAQRPHTTQTQRPSSRYQCLYRNGITGECMVEQFYDPENVRRRRVRPDNVLVFDRDYLARERRFADRDDDDDSEFSAQFFEDDDFSDDDDFDDDDDGRSASDFFDDDDSSDDDDDSSDDDDADDDDSSDDDDD